MMNLDRGKMIRTWRLALTCIFLFFISWYYEIPESSWSLVTIWFVMYEYSTVGGVLNKSMLRFFGTVISASYGAFIIYFCGNDPLINMFALIAGLFFYSYWFMGNDKTYTGTIGAVTLTIVLLNYNNVEVAILRALNVVIGIIISIFMIRFFYPQYARTHVLETQQSWLSQLEAFLKKYLDIQHDFAALQEQSNLLAAHFLTDIATYNRLVAEAKMETKAAPLFCSYSLEIKELIQRLYYLVNAFSTLLSHQETRTNPWIIKQLLIVLTRLGQIKNVLQGINDPLWADFPFVAVAQQAASDEEVMVANRELIEPIFNELQEILLQLEQVVQEYAVHVSLFKQCSLDVAQA